MSSVRLFEGDCLDVMPKLIDEGVTVDLILTDPPYLMNYKTNHIKDKSHDFCKPILNDNNKQIISESIPLIYDLLKDSGGIYMFCNANKIDIFKQELEKYFKIKNILVWVKNNWTAGDLKGAYAKQTEFIIYATKGRRLLNGRRDSDVLHFNKVKRKEQVHQNQKPVDLLEYVLLKSTSNQDLVLDCFMGSGSTGVACTNTNRNFIGIEQDHEYYKIAEQRINEAQSQQRLI